MWNGDGDELRRGRGREFGGRRDKATRWLQRVTKGGHESRQEIVTGARIKAE